MNPLVIGTDLVSGRVRLKGDALKKIRLTLDMPHHDWAQVVEVNDLLGAPVAILDRALAGSRVWEVKHLTRQGIIQPRKVRESEVPLKFRKSMLPPQRRDLIHGEAHSNLDFGFTPTQAMALDALEKALADNEHPCVGGDHRRQYRAAVVKAHNQIIKLGLLDALTTRERVACDAAFFSNTVLQ